MRCGLARLREFQRGSEGVPVPARPRPSVSFVTMSDHSRICLSSPHLSGLEQQFVADAFESNWVAPLGPHVDAFEREFAAAVGASHAVALASGTAALHLALRVLGVRPGDEVVAPTFTFAATVNPIVYVGATPVLIDSERESWNMDPSIVAETLRSRARRGTLPSAVVVAHIYGQSADLEPIRAACQEHSLPLIEDAAEALGATYHGRAPGTIGTVGVFSFNGNKIITTSGGGMLVSDNQGLVEHARKLATQARDPAPHYEHSEVGYNYRLSNVLAAIGRGQIAVLESRVAARRRNYEFYREALGDLAGLGFMPEASWGRHTRWLTVVTIDADELGTSPEQLRVALDEHNIEARPVWKPMHQQPVFRECDCIGGSVADALFARGLCLPSGSNLTAADLDRIVGIIGATIANRQKRRELERAHVYMGPSTAAITRQTQSGAHR
jgi:dTDP-4-amino-4,6-dideoxygalactose transaminase